MGRGDARRPLRKSTLESHRVLPDPGRRCRTPGSRAPLKLRAPRRRRSEANASRCTSRKAGQRPAYPADGIGFSTLVTMPHTTCWVRRPPAGFRGTRGDSREAKPSSLGVAGAEEKKERGWRLALYFSESRPEAGVPSGRHRFQHPRHHAPYHLLGTPASGRLPRHAGRLARGEAELLWRSVVSSDRAWTAATSGRAYPSRRRSRCTVPAGPAAAPAHRGPWGNSRS